MNRSVTVLAICKETVRLAERNQLRTTSHPRNRRSVWHLEQGAIRVSLSGDRPTIRGAIHDDVNAALPIMCPVLYLRVQAAQSKFRPLY